MQTTPVLKNKLFLYLTEFFAGMSVMAVELGSEQTACSLFQFLPDRVDNHYRHHYDRHGSW